MHALLRILHLFAAFGLLVPASAQPPTLRAEGGAIQCRSAALERIALAHGPQGETQANSSFEGGCRGTPTPDQADGAEPQIALERPTFPTIGAGARQQRRARERAQLALAHLRVNGSADAAGSRA
ncbi:MAG: hypothetical protein JNN27_18995 [Planctomycetes bacterium]|nr:hypothetical protein [Planctomycetota bacterium]